ncbi:MAG: methyltransferase domain-containing protein [Alphaproteobacteria bacterium]|nr:methyltransferase domain-containing protein [Alphaproteobacteria bacterium]
MHEPDAVPAWAAARGESFALRAILMAAARIEIGELTILGPDGRAHVFKGAKPGPRAAFMLRTSRAARRVLFGGNVGFAEAYIDGEIDADDLPALLELAARNESALDDIHYGRASRLAPIVGLARRLWHALRANTRSGSRRNIAYHYDLGNEFYRRWLDPSMAYSSAVFADGAKDLEAAQQAKFARMAKMMAIEPGQRVLEIGCGWGAFAAFLAREFRAKVTAITVSKEQLAHTQAKVQKEGLGDLVEARFVDYRDVEGTFDRIASIEMFEAVGEKYWPAYFGKLRECLAPGGRAALQIITISDRFFDTYRTGVDFIQRYIFPGGMLPSESALKAQIDDARLQLAGQFNFGLDYAETLAEWNRRFQKAWPEIQGLGFDSRFKRMWEFYLAYCEAGFRARSIDVTQVAIVRP